MDATGFLKTVLDLDRLAVLGLVAARPRSASELAGETGQPRVLAGGRARPASRRPRARRAGPRLTAAGGG